MTTYIPDAWAVVRFTSPDQIVDKVMSGWYGGYGGSDSWRISSGILSIEDKGDHYTITNYSGSVYECGKQVQRMTGLMNSVYYGWETLSKNNPDMKMKIEIIKQGDSYEN